MTQDKQPVRIMLVDDHQLVREGFASMLGLVSHFKVIGQSSNGRDALEFIRKHKPDIVLMDIRMPDGSGIEITRKVKEEMPEVDIILLSMYDEEEYVLEGIRAGASGYMLKDVSREELIRTIEVVRGGGSYIQPSLARRVLEEFAHRKREIAVPTRSRETHLTDREIQILQKVADGMTNRLVAETLNISEKTVKAHLRSIFRKLEVSDRAQAVAEGMRRRLLE